MPDYKKSKIYRIVCNETGEQYFGSTTQSLARRLSKHKNQQNRKTMSKQIIARGNYDIVLCEEFPCENKEQLHARERKWIEENQCVNKKIPGRTQQEWREENIERHNENCKKWRDKNREKQNEYNKKWRDENRDKIREIQRNYRNKQKLKSLVTTNATEETGLQD